MRIDGVVRFDATYGHADDDRGFSSTDEVEVARYVLSRPHAGTSFPGASCRVSYVDFAREVVRLAQAALDFAAGAEKLFVDDFDRSEWLGWQAEIRETLASVAARLR